MDLDTLFPRLKELDIAVAIDTCKQSGAINAANALSKHITRETMELERAQAALSYVIKRFAPDFALWPSEHTYATNAALDRFPINGSGDV